LSAFELRLELPPGIDAASFRARVLAKVKKEVDEVDQTRFGPASTVRAAASSAWRLTLRRWAVDVADAPKVLRPVNGGHGAKAVKRVSATDPAREKQAVKALVQWERKVKDCVRRVKRGERDVLLPAGTHHLWRHRGTSREEGRPPHQLVQAA